MPNFVKSKFTGLLKGLLKRFDEGDTQTVPAPTRTTTPAQPAPAAVPPRRPQVAPAPSPAQPAKVRTAGELQLPLEPVIASLPMELRAKIAQAPANGATFSVPVDKVLTQLAHGSVKITFGELRQAVPGLFVNSGGENDSRPVTLPLNLILPQINPSLLVRRPAQKLEVSDEIAGPFGTRAEGVNFTSAPAKAAPTPLPKGSETPAAPLEPLPVTPPPTFTPKAAPPTPAPAVPVTAAKTVPTAPAPLPKPSAAAPVKPAAPASPKTAASAAPAKPVAPVVPPSAAPLPTAKTFAATPPPAAVAPVPAAAPVPAPEPPAPVIEPSAPIPFSLAPSTPAGGFNSAPMIPIAAEPTVSAPLSALVETWPDALKSEIVQHRLSGSEVALPLSLIEPGLKRGRITATWKNVRAMIRPTPPPASAHDTTEVELPLKVIAPLFFASQKAGSQPKQKTISVTTEIPNLFTGSKHSEPAMAPMPAPTAPPPPPPSGSAASSWGDLFTGPTGAPAAPAKPVTAVPPGQLKSEDTNYYSKIEPTTEVSDTEFRRQASPGTDFLTRGASPKEIIAQAAALPGVTGAVIALPDGLKVASEVPAEFNADMLAAFLPQIFARTSQSTKELRMGELNNLSFTVGNVPWKVFRVNAVYFAAFGRAGEPLPTAQLAALAVLLDRKNK